jgi:hypothetical protein
MRAIVIDPFNRDIREEESNARLFVVGPAAGGCLESGFHLSISGRDVLYVHRDQAGQPGFELREQNIFFGWGLITGGNDGHGCPRPARLSVKHVTGIIRFLEQSEDGLRYAT